jgi:hypothetical protein
MSCSGLKQRIYIVRQTGINISKKYIYSTFKETGSAPTFVTPISFISILTNQYN